MLYVAYYPEGAHVHDAECPEIGQHLRLGAELEGDAAEDFGYAVADFVAAETGWSETEGLDRTIFYPCVRFPEAPEDGPEDDRPSPGALAGRAAEFRPRPLPFDEDGDHDATILEAVYGRKIIWLNSLSDEREMATLYPVGRNPETGIRYNKMTSIGETASGRRVLTFCATEGGYRSVALDTILEVK